MKRKYFLILIMSLLLIGTSFSETRNDPARSKDKEQFKKEAERLKTEYSAREDQITKYYRQEFKRLKERQSEELDALHKELTEKYQELENKYDIKDPIQTKALKKSKSAHKTKSVQPVKKKQMKSTSVRQKTKPGAK